MSTKTAIIHIRTTPERKATVSKLAKALPGYTATRLIEEGVDLIVAKKSRVKAK
jgi:hypothetical protein